MNLTDFFIRKYDKTDSKRAAETITYRKFKHKIRRYNKFVAAWYKLTSRHPKYRLVKDAPSGKRIIVSLTSFPVRIKTLWMTIESILRQEYKPDMIILWLYAGETNDATLPKSLLKLQKRGLTINYVDTNLKPHKKYFYAIQQYPEDVVITIDDDCIYGSRMLSNLVELNRSFPDAVCATRAKVVTRNADGAFEPYRLWENTPVPVGIPSFSILGIGYGGTLYPPKALHPATFDLDAIQKTALRVDDIWLKAGEILNGTKTAAVEGQMRPLPIIIKKDEALQDTNIGKNENDIYLTQIEEYFLHSLKRNPFDEIGVVVKHDIANNPDVK